MHNQLLTELKQYYVLRRTDTNEIFYVGCTTRKLIDRLRHHRNGRQKTADIIKQYPVVIELIYVQKPNEDWQELERNLIAKYKSDGHPLINECIGGMGAMGRVNSESNRKSISERASVPVFLKKIGEDTILEFTSNVTAAEYLRCTQPAISMAISRQGSVKGHLASYTKDFTQNSGSKRYLKNK